ncbi:MAG TPA: ABC transporter ATP-binding protein [Solirubrobacteraceae bacterium]|nr:ABC transporter ATP-binding protein [Solirubrobacteraceae bacterium]
MSALLSLRRISLSFPRGRRHLVPVLSDVSLQIARGEVLAVLAQRAQGKTSLLRVAAGMQRPNRGEVLFDGESLWHMSDRRRARLLRERIALVEAGAPALDVPVLTGVALPLLATHGRRAAYGRAQDALAQVGAGDCAEQRWSELADWERALVALAHGVVREPELLLVDDLTVTLGLGESDEIARMLEQLAAERGLGVLICANDAGAVAGAQRVASLRGGELLLAPRERPEPAPTTGATVLDFPGERPQQASS